MILRWLIFSSLAMAAAEAASVNGRVVLEGSREAVVTKKRDYSGVVVWLEPLLQPGREGASRPTPATMAQRDKAFVPHILAVETGAVVDFPNYDPIFHNAFSNYDGRVFDVGLYPPGTTRKVKFDRPGIVRVFCNIHSSMSAVIVVIGTRHFATTDRSGAFDIAGVPAGRYTLKVFHERARSETLRSLERQVQVSGDLLSLGELRISEAGYLPISHQNKYGQDYGPDNEHSHLYPSAKK